MGGIGGANSKRGGSHVRGRGAGSSATVAQGEDTDSDPQENEESDAADSHLRAKGRSPHNMTFVEALLASEVRPEPPFRMRLMQIELLS